jgi:hypothetical protein
MAIIRSSPLLLLLLAVTPAAKAYSVLTHEAIIDASWEHELKPLLLARFPGSTEDQLRDAHAHAYGGAIIQDMGYYPFGSHFFSDLTHYVRSGDFIVALIRDSQDLNEYAFALGALAHYAADNEGHPVAVNRAEPLIYPKIAKKFGHVVTYEDDPKTHLKTEFGFDVVQVARGKYASQTYHDFIGFQVSKDLLARAFEDTYSLPLKDQFTNIDLALGTYRFAVSELIPEMTKTAWSAKRKDIERLQAGMNRRKFVYRLSRASYHKEWDRQYQRPGLWARFLAWLFHIMPKIGPFSALAFKVPTPQAEKLFIASFDDTLGEYRKLIAEAQQNQLHLINENFDTGQPTRFGQYLMADAAYEKLLEKLGGGSDKTSADKTLRVEVSKDLRDNIVAFYQGSPGPKSEKARSVLMALENQSASAISPPPSPSQLSVP